MTQPTTRDEAWRYADGDALAGLALPVLEGWQEIAVPAGGAHHACLVLNGAEPEVQRLRLVLEPGATAEIFALNAGGDYARLELEVHLKQGSAFTFGGVTIGGGAAVREIVTRVIHEEPEASSAQVVRAVHWGQATGNYLGRVDVTRDGQHTDAAQDFKGLLLERGATANARPELEIFADDVKCAHGAAIGQLDEAAAFYMAARGLPPQLARALQVQAFIADAFAALADNAAREDLQAQALAVLEGAGL